MKERESTLMLGINFEMKTMKDYHLYLTCDVLLLADVFGKFRKNSLKNYGLCPSLIEHNRFKLGCYA